MIRRVLIGIGLLVALIVAGIGGLVYWLAAGDGVRIAMERQASAWLGQPIRIGAATAQFYPRIGVQLHDVRIGEPAQVTFAEVRVSTGLRPLLSRRIEDADVIVANSRIDMPLPFDLPTGHDATEASAETESRPSYEIVSVRRIALSDVTVASRGREIVLSVSSSLNGSVLTVDSVEAVSRDTRITGTGVVQLEPVTDAKLDLTANRLDLDDLIALADAFAPRAGAPGSATTGNGRLEARVSADSVTAAGLTVPQFSTRVRVQGNRVSLSPTAFVLFGGRYEGDLDLRLGEPGTMTLASKLRDVDVAQLAAFGGAPDTITGKLSGTGTFTGRGGDIGSILASARGNGTASIVDGTIKRLNLVRTVILFFGRPAPDTATASDAFDRIDARFSLARQLITADALSLRSRDADIVGSGTLALDTKALDGKADVSLSEELSAQAGRDLVRYTREGNRVVLPAAIGGSLSAPRITIDAGAAVKRGLRNEVESRLKGLLDRFGGAN